MTICSRQSVQLYIRTCYIFFCKQKTAYEVRISDWSSDVCSSDLLGDVVGHRLQQRITLLQRHVAGGHHGTEQDLDVDLVVGAVDAGGVVDGVGVDAAATQPELDAAALGDPEIRSEEHTSELQSLMRISYAVFCLTKKTSQNHKN